VIAAGAACMAVASWYSRQRAMRPRG
jgi:hypothetical protein